MPARLLAALFTCLPAAASAAGTLPDLTRSSAGYLAVAVFVIAYLLVVVEEFSHLRKSKPVIVAAGLIWVLVALALMQSGRPDAASTALRHNLLEYAELLLFMLSAMAYINTIEERGVFRALRARMVNAGLSLRAIFWLTGVIAFFLSSVADNLTTALVMGAVVVTVGAGQSRFLVPACINIVVAANAGGAFSPFGDITTLMVWQKGIVPFWDFFHLFLPSLVNWLVPAALMSFALPPGRPAAAREAAIIKRGGGVVVALFALTIALTVSMHHFLHLPPFLGMMSGLGLLKLYGYLIRRGELRAGSFEAPMPEEELRQRRLKPAHKPFDIFISMKRIEWDTLMFFYGIVLCVGGLGALGYLALLSDTLYHGLGATQANVLVGVVSAIIDNIPVMYAVLNMQPDMSLGQWLLVTLTAGVGGSLLSIGSAAGVALMGQARGTYTFFAHLRWSWAIALGYVASIYTHFLVNDRLFTP
jgi:Na+/H+ antiporter NhaD/arsenite permease-like protein